MFIKVQRKFVVCALFFNFVFEMGTHYAALPDMERPTQTRLARNSHRCPCLLPEYWDEKGAPPHPAN